jgi:hypothetical protein
MRFLKKIHTKEFLIQNPDALFELSKQSATFAASDLAQDFEILNINVGNELEVKVAHILASQSIEWAKTPAAQNINVVSLKATDNSTVAHCLATNDNESQWSKTDIAQRKDVLTLTDDFGNFVAHCLAIHSNAWGESDFAQDHDFISTIQPSGKMIAHALAGNLSWIKSAAAQDFRNLALKDADHNTVGLKVFHTHAGSLGKFEETQLWMRSAAAKDKRTLFLTDKNKVSVAQHMIYNLVPEEQTKLIVNLISQGAALKTIVVWDITKGMFYSKLRIGAEDLSRFMNEAENIINDENEPLIQTKMLIAYHSTLRNLYPCIEHESAQEVIRIGTEKAERLLIEMIEDSPDIVSQYSNFSDDNCEPWLDFYRKRIAEKSFELELPSQPLEEKNQIKLGNALY